MRVLAGLGNPGQEYDLTRHNIGFMLADLLAETASRSGDEQILRAAAVAILGRTRAEKTLWRERDGSLVTEIQMPEGPLWLVKPQQYMNRSGEPLNRFLGFYKLGLDQLMVAHDEIDLPVGALRLKPGGGDGGHNGLKSIRQAFGSGEYARIRLGVGRPPISEDKDGQVVNWVLGRFSKDDTTVVADLLVRAALSVNVIMGKGMTKAQNLFNR